MAGPLVTSLWLLDRGTALVATPALWVSVLTGVFVRTRRPAFAHALADRYHTRIAMFGLIVVLMHALAGTLDAAFLWLGWAPAPAYPGWLFTAGVVVGALSLVGILVAVASFLAPWLFDNPSLVHALAYLGFIFGILHGVAIGTDMVGLTASLAVVSLLVVAVALVAKFTVGLGAGIKRAVRTVVSN